MVEVIKNQEDGDQAGLVTEVPAVSGKAAHLKKEANLEIKHIKSFMAMKVVIPQSNTSF